MILVYLVHVIVALILIKKAYSKGLSEALPFFCMVMILGPGGAQIRIPEFFDISLQRTAVIIMFFLFILLRGSKNAFVNRDLKIVQYLIIIAILWQLLSNSNSIVPIISFKRMLAYILEYYVVYFILVNSIDDLRNVYRILSSFVIAMTIACVFGLIELYSGWTPGDMFPHEIGRFELMKMGSMSARMRIHSVFPHAILFGGAIAITVPMAFHLLRVYNRRWHKTLLWISIVIMMFCLYKTGSRGPWLALFLSIVLLFLFHRQSRKYVIIFFTITCFTLIIRPGVWKTLEARIYSTLDPTTPLGSSYEYRFVLYRLVGEKVSKDLSRMIYGYGQDSFYYLELETEFDGRIYKFLSCDSAWAGFLIEFGYVGLFIMFLLLSWIGYTQLKNYFTLSPPHNLLSSIFLITFFVFYFLMLSVEALSFGQLGIYFWMIAALSMAYVQILQNQRVLEQIELEKLKLNIKELRES
jgi:hypothetical protein